MTAMCASGAPRFVLWYLQYERRDVAQLLWSHRRPEIGIHRGTGANLHGYLYDVVAVSPVPVVLRNYPAACELLGLLGADRDEVVTRSLVFVAFGNVVDDDGSGDGGDTYYQHDYEQNFAPVISRERLAFLAGWGGRGCFLGVQGFLP